VGQSLPLRWPLLQRLRQRGTSEGQLGKLGWENVLRVLREAE